MTVDPRTDETAQSVAAFVSLVAHELRGTTTGILTHAWTVNEYWDRLSDEERRRSVKSISRRAQRLARLINNLLTFSRLEAGRALDVQVRVFDLGALVECVCGELREEHPERPIVLELPGPVSAVGDEAHTEQVLVNLIEHACEFSPEDTPVTVRVLVRPDWVGVQVADQGPGVAPGDFPRLFQRLTRLRVPGTGGSRGIGIGLYLCRLLVEAQGGRIWAESDKGGETRFTFSLPRPSQGRRVHGV